MKNLLLIVLPLLSANVFAQSSGDPTKEDAVNFIKKVYAENLDLDNEIIDNGKLYSVDVSLEGCNLIIARVFGKLGAISRDSVVINLSAVKLDLSCKIYIEDNSSTEGRRNGIEPIENGAIYGPNYYMGKLLYKNDKINMRINIGSYSGDGLYKLRDKDIFINHGYPLRLIKAYEFLIKGCGGGKMKVNPNDKF